MVNFGAKVSLETILDAMADKVGTSGDELLEDERVLVTLADDADFDDNPVGDSFLIIAPKEFTAIEGMVTGGGKYETGMDGRIEVDFWNRFEVDEVLRDRQALRDASYGLLAKWTELMTSLQLYAPLNSAGKCILIEPMRIRGFQVQPRRRKSPWLVIRSQWQVKFVQDLGV